MYSRKNNKCCLKFNLITSTIQEDELGCSESNLHPFSVTGIGHYYILSGQGGISKIPKIANSLERRVENY